MPESSARSCPQVRSGRTSSPRPTPPARGVPWTSACKPTSGPPAAGVVLGSSPAYRLAARLRLDHLEEIAPRAPGWAAAEARVVGRGFDALTRRAEAHATLLGASLRGVVLRGGALHARLDGEQLRLETASVQGPEATASVTGILDLGRQAVDVTLDATADLRPLGERLGLPLAGSARATGTARGPLTALAVTARADLEDLAYGAF